MEQINYDTEIIRKYKEVLIDLLPRQFESLTMGDILEAIDYSITKRFKNTDVTIDNNYIKQTSKSTLYEISNYILSRDPIITSYGVMFKRHGTVPNPIYNMIIGFISARSDLKAEMFKHPKGSEDYEKYNLLQNLAKLDANGFYGVQGMYSCIYYNLYIASTVTTMGRSLNSTAALLFESILNNNVPFGSLNELIMFIYNVKNEKRTFKDIDILDRDITFEECFLKLTGSVGFWWIPTQEELEILWELILTLDNTTINRLFYKNNLYHFCDNSRVLQGLTYIFCKLEKPFLDPNNPPEEIKEEYELFYNLMYEYIYYDKQIIDRLEKMESLVRSVSIIQDTDSAIISLDGWYRYILDKLADTPMTIKNIITNPVDDTTEQIIVPITQYDFLTDEIVEMDRAIHINKVTPQDGFRYSIINLMSNCIMKLANDYLVKYTINSNSYNPEFHKCFMNIKNEFLFRRILLDNLAKKHYAGLLEIQEGHMINKTIEDSLEVKGMEAFVKSTMNPTTQAKLKNILYEDILKSDSIDQIKVIKEIAKVEKEIYNSIQAGEKLYFKPARIKSINSYKDPLRIQGIKASIAYNALHDPSTETINLENRNSVTIIKVDINSKNIDLIKESYPEVYERAVDLLVTQEFGNKTKNIITPGSITSIALPLNEPVPGWVLPFINYTTIINDNVSLFPLESIGLFRGSKNNNYSNIVYL